jgi:hypothetical protein
MCFPKMLTWFQESPMGVSRKLRESRRDSNIEAFCSKMTEKDKSMMTDASKISKVSLLQYQIILVCLVVGSESRWILQGPISRGSKSFADPKCSDSTKIRDCKTGLKNHQVWRRGVLYTCSNRDALLVMRAKEQCSITMPAAHLHLMLCSDPICWRVRASFLWFM